MLQLKEIRKSKGIKQKEIAKELNISQSAISDYENGKLEPSIESLIKMANFLDCSVDKLVGRYKN